MRAGAEKGRRPGSARRGEAAGAPPARVVIEDVRPAVEAGRFPIKRAVGETVTVRADVHAEGHDELTVVLLHRAESDEDFSRVAMAACGNDVFEATFRVQRLERHHYVVEAWPDAFRTWRRDLAKRAAAGLQADVDLQTGALLVAGAAERAHGPEAALLEATAAALGDAKASVEERTRRALEDSLLALADRHPDREQAARSSPELLVSVDRERARFSSWYEFFPRSATPEPGRHGTFADAEARLDYVASLGFHIVYLPPIHPIGRVKRKGKNNEPEAGPGDPGSPWAIGAAEGGHTAIHPDLGTLEDFRRLEKKARTLGLELALDLAFQAAPDHPWVKEHPEWFSRRPDGSVQYAENPPKKYEDIYPLNFESEDWRGLWEALADVVRFWIAQGVRVFRVDNPHTKPYAFWEWLIGEMRRDHPDLIFLAEAFTRPKVMARLAKLGFNQSYTYYTWRNSKREITDYVEQLVGTDLVEYFRPNFWPNTPDILPEPLQYGGRPASALRVLLAATLSSNYGLYGPAFELLETRARTPGSEEYLDSEKYEVRHWHLDQPESLRELIARVNRIRNDNPALQQMRRLRFHPVDNDHLLAFSKTSDDGDNVVVVVVNLDPHHTQSGWIELPLADLGLPTSGVFQVHDLLSDARFFWNGPRNFVQLDPQVQPGHVFRARKKVRTERDFDYFL